MSDKTYGITTLTLGILLIFASSFIVFNALSHIPKVNETEIINNLVMPESPVSYREVTELVNVKRSQSGVTPALHSSQALNQSAQLKADDMVKQNYWSHNDPQGKDPWHFLESVGYDYQYAGENLAKCYYTPKDVVEAWFNSPSHRDNLLNPNYKDVGYGIGTLQDGCLLIVQHLGDRL